MRRFDVITVLLLLVGGVVIPVVGWIAGPIAIAAYLLSRTRLVDPGPGR